MTEKKAKEKKLKVLWICYFSNETVHHYLKPRKSSGEFAPWISNMIGMFEDNDEIELHVVSQHEWITGYKSFEAKGVTYHFFNRGMPFTGRHWPGFFSYDVWTGFRKTKKYIRRIVRDIKPDIIHLHGAENDFSSAILQFRTEYPVLITVQGFIGKTLISSKRIKMRIQNESEIFRNFKHFGIRTATLEKEVKELNPFSVTHWHRYPKKEIQPRNTEKVYDLVIFARISKDKGIIDLLKAVSILKKDNPGIRLCVIGPGKTDEYRKFAFQLNISDNIHWFGFLPTLEEVYNTASKAKISVLPTYHDIISGTIIESLFLKIPVVAYKAGSIPEVNKNGEVISLVDIGDVNGLAASIGTLLQDDRLRAERAEKGYLRAVEMFRTDDGEIRKELLEIYRKVIHDFNPQ